MRENGAQNGINGSEEPKSLIPASQMRIPSIQHVSMAASSVGMKNSPRLETSDSWGVSIVCFNHCTGVMVVCWSSFLCSGCLGEESIADTFSLSQSLQIPDLDVHVLFLHDSAIDHLSLHGLAAHLVLV